MTNDIVSQFQNARRVATPLVVIRTTDAAALVIALTAANNGDPVIQWNAAAGFESRNKPGVSALRDMTSEPLVLNPADAMHSCVKLKANSIVFVYNAHRVWQDLTTAQGIWNLRDKFKADHRTLVLLTTPEATPPRELDSDVIVLDDPLPDDIALQGIVIGQYLGATPPLEAPSEETLRKAVDALKGLSAFVAEQIVALCLTRKGVNMAALWERKRQAVEQTPGASVFRQRVMFADIGGHEGLKRDLMREITSKRPVKLVVIFDEFEKMMAGTAGDTSGVSQDAAQVVLTYMQDHAVRGVILFGSPGSGKTIVAKAMGSEADCLVILADIGSMKGSLVGESEAKIRAFFSVITAVAGDGGAFFVATCNSTAVLSTELRRRFKTGFYFVDLPDRKEKDSIWAIHMAKHNLPKQRLPEDKNWTGAEIEVCCEKSDNYSISLVEAAKSIVPVAEAQPELIEARRREAHNRMLSSSTGRAYQMPGAEIGKPVPIPKNAYVSPLTVRQLTDLPES